MSIPQSKKSSNFTELEMIELYSRVNRIQKERKIRITSELMKKILAEPDLEQRIKIEKEFKEEVESVFDIESSLIFSIEYYISKLEKKYPYIILKDKNRKINHYKYVKQLYEELRLDLDNFKDIITRPDISDYVIDKVYDLFDTDINLSQHKKKKLKPIIFEDN